MTEEIKKKSINFSFRFLWMLRRAEEYFLVLSPFSTVNDCQMIGGCV